MTDKPKFGKDYNHPCCKCGKKGPIYAMVGAKYYCLACLQKEYPEEVAD